MSSASREMTLSEWVDKLRGGQSSHGAVIEYDKLKAREEELLTANVEAMEMEAKGGK